MTAPDKFFKEFHALKKENLAVLSNYATYASNGYPLIVECIRQGFNIKKIFSPEHGVSAQGADGTIQKDSIDLFTQLPIISLYGNKIIPAEKDLDNIDWIVVDLPNIGCRFYTYFWTITHLVEICARLNKKIIFLDSPNLSRRKIQSTEGPMLDENTCSSFLGRWGMPLSFSFTYGDLLQWFIAERKIKVNLQVVSYDKTGESANISFIPPSPSIAEWQTTLIYPCTALFEGLNLNTGRGTSTPFKILGAPWINPLQFFKDISDFNLMGIQAFPYSFRPEWSRYAGETCHGLFFNVHDPNLFRPVHAGLLIMNYLSSAYPEFLQEATYPTSVNPDGKNHLDLLLGIPKSFSRFCSGKPLSDDEIRKLLDVSSWTEKVVARLSK